MTTVGSLNEKAQGMVNAMPALFLGHGNPMHALTPNRYAEAWQRIGQRLPKPKAILSISAHWYVPMSAVTIAAQPRTIHDFMGFPEALFHVQYPAPGSPELAHRVQQLLAPTDVKLDETWGLDHGTWAVLKHVYPAADVPVVQLAIDSRQPVSFHFELGKQLAPLRNEDVLILGSGNIVHNIRAFAWSRPDQGPYDWAARFETKVRELIRTGDFEPLIKYEQFGRDAMLSVPTPEHYLPLLCILGAGENSTNISFPVEGFDGGSMSMFGRGGELTVASLKIASPVVPSKSAVLFNPPFGYDDRMVAVVGPDRRVHDFTRTLPSNKRYARVRAVNPAANPACCLTSPTRAFFPFFAPGFGA